MILILYADIINKISVKDVILITLIKTLIKKIKKKLSNRSKVNIINFILIIWQRIPHLF
jgi:hypothetical protein